MYKGFRVLLMLLAACGAAAVRAELTATVTLASDYLFDGISQTQGDPALQGSIDYSHDSGLYAGAWTSNINLPNTPDLRAEVDYYLGYAQQLNTAISYDIGWARYTYPGVTDANRFDYNEVYLGIDHRAGSGFRVWRSGDYAGSGSRSLIWQLSQDLQIGRGIALHLEFDRTQVERSALALLANGEDRVDHYSIGFNGSAGGLDWELSYHNTSEDGAADDIAQPTWLLAISKRFRLTER